MDRPTAAKGRFPYSHRTVAEIDAKLSSYAVREPRNPKAIPPLPGPTMNEWGHDTARKALAGGRR